MVVREGAGRSFAERPRDARSIVTPRCRVRACALLAALALAWAASASPAGASPEDPTLEQLGCAASTLASIVPGGNIVTRVLTKAAQWASCPSFLDAVGDSVPFDQWANGCRPQMGFYSSCRWAATNAKVQTWIDSGLALNGTIDGFSDPQGWLTCIYIVGSEPEGMWAPAAAQNQGGCTLGHIWNPPPPPQPDRRVPHTFRGTGYVCASGGTMGVFLGAWRHFPEDFRATITPWEQDRSRVVLWDEGAPFVVFKDDICSSRPFVGPSFDGSAHVCTPDGTIGVNWAAGYRFFPNAFSARVTPWPQDSDGYVTLWDQGAPFAVPRGDICACGLGAELALVVPPILWLRRRRRAPGRSQE